MEMFSITLSLTILFGVVVTLLLRQYWHPKSVEDETLEYTKGEDDSKGYDEYLVFTMGGKLTQVPKTNK